MSLREVFAKPREEALRPSSPRYSYPTPTRLRLGSVPAPGPTTDFDARSVPMPNSARDSLPRTAASKLAYPGVPQPTPRTMKVVRKDAVNVSSVTSKSPRDALAEIYRACTKCRVVVSTMGQYSVKCCKQTPADVLRFEMDVARIDGDDRFVVRGKRLAGDFRMYKDLCAEILREMNL